MTWHPHITVATIVEADGRFLMVEEAKGGRLVLNQPAGHLEPDETLRDAAIRETREETGWEVKLEGVVGVYLYTAPSNGVTYQRVCFAASPLRRDPQPTLDTGIVAAHWMTREELVEQPERWRSELILRCIDDYLAGPIYDLGVVRD
ncbi:NUDIX hydrolase [Stutzerimonas zhaodongensis]|uniref:NUDIX hydrolase n=1 Tax=Stutzerimonas TaxID=2901164 RepID=UPI00388F2647